MEITDINKAPGHWILAKMGKKVLRPGGKELTEKLVSSLNISSTDEVAEFAPGLGYTASLALAKQPKSYVGIDADEDAVKLLKNKITGKNVNFILGNAAETTLTQETKDKVYGEAMLTMHADHRKAEIIREAHRILKKGGLYAIHEMGLVNASEELKSEIQKELALAIKVNARPLTEEEWKNLLIQEGFTIKHIHTNGMLLLETKRVIDDEGFLRALKIGFNILINPQAKKRINEMRKVFVNYKNHLNSIVIIAQKN